LIKIVKNPGNERLNNLNDPVLNVLTPRWLDMATAHFSKYKICVCKKYAKSTVMTLKGRKGT